MSEEQEPEPRWTPEDLVQQIKEEMLPGRAPPPDDPEAALAAIDEWTEHWILIVDAQDSIKIALSGALQQFIEQTNYLAKWCESVGIDSSPMIEFAHAARDTYYGFTPTLPPIPEALWVLLDRLKYRLQPFQLRPPDEETAPTAEPDRQPIPVDEANILVRKFLEKHPRASAREVSKGVGIALGRISGLTAWRAEQGRREANKKTVPKRERRLTTKMLETIGRTNDPSSRIEIEEAAWQQLLEEAEPRERAKLHAMTSEQRARLIQVYLEQKIDSLEASDDRS
jgi:hypothetical protein